MHRSYISVKRLKKKYVGLVGRRKINRNLEQEKVWSSTEIETDFFTTMDIGRDMLCEYIKQRFPRDMRKILI